MAYDGQKAAQYADIYWNSHNPRFPFFPKDDCTNFTSQCIYAGGAPMEFSHNRSKGWYCIGYGAHSRWSYSWTVANSFYWHLRNMAIGAAETDSGKKLHTMIMERANQLQLGDVISYDWEGNGKWGHSTVITAFDANGQPLVNAHTFNSYHRYWEYKDSPAYTPNTRYTFFHFIR